MIKSSLTRKILNTQVNLITHLSPSEKRSAMVELDKNSMSYEENTGKWRKGTSLFFDFGLWIGVDDALVRAPLTNKNPSIREIIDFYMFPRMTSLGSFPLQTLFLRCEWDKYGLSQKDLELMHHNLKESVGALGYAMIVDTMNFVMTGERDIPISLLISYMDNDVSTQGAIVEERFSREELSNLSTTQFLTKWISTQKGMSDCIQIHRLIFNIEY